MTPQARPNLGGLFNGSTPADRVSSIAGRLGPRLVSAPVGHSNEDSAPAPAKDEHVPEADQVKATAPVSWVDPIRALELYFGLLQAALDANRQFVMGLANVVVTGGTRLRGGLGSLNTRP